MNKKRKNGRYWAKNVRYYIAVKQWQHLTKEKWPSVSWYCWRAAILLSSIILLEPLPFDFVFFLWLIVTGEWSGGISGERKGIRVRRLEKRWCRGRVGVLAREHAAQSSIIQRIYSFRQLTYSFTFIFGLGSRSRNFPSWSNFTNTATHFAQAPLISPLSFHHASDTKESVISTRQTAHPLNIMR